MQSAVVNFSGDLFSAAGRRGAHGHRHGIPARNVLFRQRSQCRAQCFHRASARLPTRFRRRARSTRSTPSSRFRCSGRRSIARSRPARYSDYNRFGNTTNPKVGLKWRPDRDPADPRFVGHGLSRADVHRSVRRPDARLRTPSSIRAPVPNFASLPGCGGRQAPANTTGTFVVSGGNPDLLPEEADNLTVGAVFTPGFAPRLAVTLDFYRIEKEGIIGSIDRNFVLAQNAANGSYADRITRDATHELRARGDRDARQSARPDHPGHRLRAAVRDRRIDRSARSCSAPTSPIWTPSNSRRHPARRRCAASARTPTPRARWHAYAALAASPGIAAHSR